MATASLAKKSDLGVRTLSAIVMLAVAGGALWLGGWVWAVFVTLVALGVWFEWSTLVLLFKAPGTGRTIWQASGAVYCGVAVAMLMAVRDVPLVGIFWVLVVVGAVIATDVGAYFFGRLIGGPKIAPRISPSKTWAGLFGGMLGAAVICGILTMQLGNHSFMEAIGAQGSMLAVEVTPMTEPRTVAIVGAFLAIVAQAGDFFQSWMKRRAGVKDSGNLIPGHGGLFDRVDGLLAVSFVLGVIFIVSRLWGGS